MSPPDSTAPLSSALRSSSMKPSDMPLPLLGEKFGRSYTCGMARKKPARRGDLRFEVVYLASHRGRRVDTGRRRIVSS
jgi:hypothetical protein